MNTATPLLKTYRLVLALVGFLASTWIAYKASTMTSASGPSLTSIILFQFAISFLYVPFMSAKQMVRRPEPGTQLQDFLVLLRTVGINTANIRQAKRRMLSVVLGRVTVAVCFWIFTAATLYAMVHLGTQVSLAYPHYCAALVLPIIAALLIEPAVARLVAEIASRRARVL